MMLLSFGVGERPLALVLGRFAQRGDVPDRAERPAVRLRLALTDDQATLALAEPHGPGAAIVDDCGHEVRVRTRTSTKGSHTRTLRALPALGEATNCCELAGAADMRPLAGTTRA